MKDITYYKIYLTEKSADITRLPVDGVTDVILEIGNDLIERMDECFLDNGIYDAIDALFGPGDSDYVSYDKCIILVDRLKKLDESDKELKEWLDKLIEIANVAIENESGLFFDL